MTVLLWILAVAMIVAGVVGTVLPALPGAALVFAGVLLAAWIDDFTRISGWVVAIMAALTAIAFAADLIAGMLGARKVGASRLALVGAAVGTIAGVFTGLVGLVFLPLAGAAAGEYLARRDLGRAGRVGVATWIGLLVGTAVKVAVVATMVGVFAAALLIA
ncbi:MAG: DUF456 domain-containing protein [Burkholderiales bacterium]|nr:DUF456 domain-containing protein [Burkholderiales bacterium]